MGIRMTNKEIQKLLKELDYTEHNRLLSLLHSDISKLDYAVLLEKVKKLQKDYVKLKYYPQQRLGIGNVIDGIPTVKSNLYSTPKIHVLRKQEGKSEKGETVKSFVFFIYIQNIEEEKRRKFLKMLKDSCVEKEILLLGRRTSQGNNIYRMQHFEIEESAEPETALYLNLGKLLPSQIEYESSYLELFTSERKPFHMDLALDKSWNDKCFLSFLGEGSVICKKNSFFNTGKSIENPFNKGTIVFGNSFLLPI